MAQTVNVTDADTYFANNVLHSKPWDSADTTTKNKALTNAENILYRYYSDNYSITDSTKKQLPKEAIYEQALWMLRQDEAIQKAEMGVLGIGVEGINLQFRGKADYIAPEAMRIINHDLGNSGGLLWITL